MEERYENGLTVLDSPQEREAGQEIPLAMQKEFNYTVEQLRHLRDIRAIGLDGDFADDEYGTERELFRNETNRFFDWLDKMERRGRIEELLQSRSKKRKPPKIALR